MNDMTKGNPLRLILRFAVPLLLGNLLQQFYNIADAAIVGRFLGPDALAAVGSTGSVQFVILGFCIGTCTGFCVPITQRFGGKQYPEMRSLLFNSILLTGLIALIATSSCVLLCKGILRILSVPENIWANAYIYILIIFAGIPFSLLYNLAAGILRSVGDSRTPFLVLAVSTVSNIVLDLACVMVLHMGCAGAALATIMSQALSGFLCTWVIIRKYEILHIRPEERKANRRRIRHLLLTGVPMGLQFSITGIGGMVLQSATNSLGSLYASARTVAGRINMLAMCPLDSLSSGVATYCSQNYGAGDYARVREGVKISTIAAMIYGALTGAVLILFGRGACLIFLSAKEGQILDAAQLLLRRTGYFYVILGLLDIARITVQALGRAGRAVIAGVMEMVGRAGVVLLFVPKFGFDAITFADAAAWILADLYIVPVCLMLLRRVKRDLSIPRRTAGKSARQDY